MTFKILLVLLLSGACAGWLAGLVTRGSGFGLAGNFAMALLGAIVGYYLLGAVGLTLGGSSIGVAITSLAGAFACLALVGQIRR